MDNKPEVVDITWNDVFRRAEELGELLYKVSDDIGKRINIYGIPRGGVYVAALLGNGVWSDRFTITEDTNNADIFVDDIIDSGRTRTNYITKYKKPFYALIDKIGADKSYRDQWISFPWERMGGDEGPVENIVRLLEYIGDDPTREGLKETPVRVIKSYETLFGGYKQKPEEVSKIFTDGACDEMVILKDIEFYSTCEHHMLPFFGKAHIAYIPNGKVIGVSKLARLLEIYARRLQIQERICQEVTASLNDMLDPKGSACILHAQHFCMTARGVQKQKSIMVTSSLTGSFQNQNTRTEFLSLIGS